MFYKVCDMTSIPSIFIVAVLNHYRLNERLFLNQNMITTIFLFFQEMPFIR